MMVELLWHDVASSSCTQFLRKAWDQVHGYALLLTLFCLLQCCLCHLLQCSCHFSTYCNPPATFLATIAFLRIFKMVTNKNCIGNQICGRYSLFSKLYSCFDEALLLLLHSQDWVAFLKLFFKATVSLQQRLQKGDLSASYGIGGSVVEHRVATLSKMCNKVAACPIKNMQRSITPEWNMQQNNSWQNATCSRVAGSTEWNVLYRSTLHKWNGEHRGNTVA